MNIYVKAVDLPERVRKAVYLYNVKCVDRNEWVVYSESGRKKEYLVSFSQKGFTCSCPDYRFRRGDGKFCKHIYSVIIYGKCDKSVIATMIILYPELLDVLKFI